MLHRPTFLSLGLLMLLASHGCEDACTTIGCVDGVIITLVTPVPMSEQDLVVSVESDGAKTSCTLTPTATSCEAGELTVLVLDRAIHSLGLTGTPERIAVTISSPTTTVLSGEVLPRYETLRLNGDECPGPCKRAEATLGS